MANPREPTFAESAEVFSLLHALGEELTGALMVKSESVFFYRMLDQIDRAA
jgi:hypothetical protein